MALSGAEHGTVIFADCQTAGKGRHGKAFFSPSGHGLYMSFILRRFCFGAPLITAFAAVSVCEAIETISNKNPQIKWANDIFLNGKKICGILAEAVLDFENAQRIILGVGINFNTPTTAFPENLRQIAGAIYETDSPPATRSQLAAEIVNRVLFSDQREEEILANYKKRMFMLGKPISVTGTAEAFEAVAVDIDNIGRLIVKKADGELLSLSAGEIQTEK